MQYGLIDAEGLLRFGVGANVLGVQAPASIASSFNLTLPNALPGTTQALTVDNTGNMAYSALSGGGTVNSFSAGNLAPLFTVGVATPTTTPALTFTLTNAAQNAVFAGPSTGGAGAPTYRALVPADLPSGTIAASWQIDAGATGPRLKNVAGEVQLRNAADTAFANLRVANLVVTGTTVTVESETMTIADNILLLNSNVTGAPTENGGLNIERGTSTDASLLWDETLDQWTAGLLGAERPLARTHRASFTNANLTAGVLTVTHNLSQYCQVTVYNNSGRQIIPDEVTASSATACAIDLTSYGTITGTWNVVVVG